MFAEIQWIFFKKTNYDRSSKFFAGFYPENTPDFETWSRIFFLQKKIFADFSKNRRFIFF